MGSVYKMIVSLTNESINGRMPGEDEIADWQGQEWELYLDNFPKSIEASQMTGQKVSTMLGCGQNGIIFLSNNGEYSTEVEIHDGPYNVIKNWNYTGLVQTIDNGEGKCWTAKFHEAANGKDNTLTVSKINGEEVHVCTTNGKTVVINISKVFPKDDEAPPGGVDDMTKLSYLHEPGLLHNLAARYELNEIYAYTGDILIAINPFHRLPHLYDTHMMEQYKGAAFGELSPRHRYYFSYGSLIILELYILIYFYYLP